MGGKRQRHGNVERETITILKVYHFPVTMPSFSLYNYFYYKTGNSLYFQYIEGLVAAIILHNRNWPPRGSL